MLSFLLFPHGMIRVGKDLQQIPIPHSNNSSLDREHLSLIPGFFQPHLGLFQGWGNQDFSGNSIGIPFQGLAAVICDIRNLGRFSSLSSSSGSFLSLPWIFKTDFDNEAAISWTVFSNFLQNLQFSAQVDRNFCSFWYQTKLQWGGKKHKMQNLEFFTQIFTLFHTTAKVGVTPLPHSSLKKNSFNL